MRRTVWPTQVRIWRIIRARMTQKEAAAFCGYSFRHYQRIEYGHARTPQRIKTLIRRKITPVR